MIGGLVTGTGNAVEVCYNISIYRYNYNISTYRYIIDHEQLGLKCYCFSKTMAIIGKNIAIIGNIGKLGVISHYLHYK